MIAARSALAAVLLAAASGVGFGWFAHRPATETVYRPVNVSQPDCPTEDSCSADYDNGRWVIVPTVP